MKRLFDLLEKILGIIVIVFAVLLICDVILQIIGRYLMSKPVSWTEELSRYLLAGIVAFGTPIVARRDQYIRVDVLLNRLPQKVRRVWVILLNLVVAVFLAIVAYSALSYVELGMLQKSPVLKLPMTVVFSSVLIGPALTALFFVERAINDVAALRKEAGS